MTRLYLILTVLALAGCTHRPVSPIMESYQFRITDHPFPRAFHEGRHWTHAGRMATTEELRGCVYGSSSAYLPERDVIQVAADGCHLATLRHEQDHQKQWHAGLRDRAELERLGMRAEIRCLYYEQGWSLERIKGLSRLNAAVSDETYAEILKP